MSPKDEGVLFSSKFLSDSNSLQYLDKYFEALASILMLNKSVDDGIGEDESVSKILKVFTNCLNRNELLCQLGGGIGSNGFHID